MLGGEGGLKKLTGKIICNGVFLHVEKYGQGAWAPWYVTRCHVRNVGCVVVLNQITCDVRCIIPNHGVLPYSMIIIYSISYLL